MSTAEFCTTALPKFYSWTCAAGAHFSFAPSKYVAFVDRDLQIDFPAEMMRIQNDMRDILSQKKIRKTYSLKLSEASAMPLTKFKLGALIEVVDERNFNNRLGADSVVGLGIQKEIITTKADLDGVSLTSYKLFPPKSFAYVPDTPRCGDKYTRFHSWGSAREVFTWKDLCAVEIPIP